MWCSSMDLDTQNVPPDALICSEHFSEKDFCNRKRIRLNNAAVPLEINAPPPMIVSPTPPTSNNRRPLVQILPKLSTSSSPVSQPSFGVTQSELPPAPSPITSDSFPNSTAADKKRIRQLQQKVRRAKARTGGGNILQKLDELTGDEDSLKSIIKSQLHRLTSRKKKKRFSQEEKVTALTIYYSSTKRGYR